ncbi:hypothetical protein ACWDA3_53555 [Nonomuraea rubra]
MCTGILAVIYLVPSSATAGITHFNTGAQDGGNVSHCYTSSMSTTGRAFAKDVFGYSGRVLSAASGWTTHASCDVSLADGNPRTDTAWFEGWRDEGYGVARCAYAWPNDGTSNEGECDQNQAWINPESIRADYPNSFNNAYWEVACHEFGHTLGFIGGYTLDRPPGGIDQIDCMHDEALLQGPNGGPIITYSNHHIADFNAYYD